MVENKVITEELVTATAVFEDITTNLSGDEYTTASSILPLLRRMKKSLQLTETDSTLLQEIKTEIYSALKCRYETENLMSLLRLCSFCDPRFKLNFVYDADITKSIALSKMTEMYNEESYNSATIQRND
ncbi:hypothetical protein AVEN_125849-1 [Araneus ventricosus]|uniref:Zinc finger BED domain-containing protein 4 n=1 Tax=Araneus ventricosus TaxID=182803 RepID=A0A4Y2VF96_ARAVE|nr:hypothetical protein AVEN_125849-1 [Araneus ventricosus]